MKEKVKDLLEWIYCIVIAVILALLFRYYIGTPTVVQMVSMKPTLVEGQRLWLNRWVRTTKKMPEKGDIITFEAPRRTSFNSNDKINNENPIAKYDDGPEGIWSKFVYYVLEIGKDSYIKRVIALPGEHVEIMNGNVYIDGKQLEEDYLPDGIVTDVENGLDDFIVPENCVFAMGDNRSHSTDCRVFGCIPLEKIESKVWIRIWPLNLFGKVK